MTPTYAHWLARIKRTRVHLTRKNGCDHRNAKPVCEQYAGLKLCRDCDTMIMVR